MDNNRENLYQFIIKTLLNSNIKKSSDGDGNIKDGESVNSNTCRLLQNALKSNQSIWDWDHFFRYLNNKQPSQLQQHRNQEQDQPHQRGLKFYILTLKEEIQIELLNWLSILVNSFDNENTPSSNLVVPVLKLKDWIQHTYVQDIFGHNTYKSNLYISYLVDSIISNSNFIIDYSKISIGNNDSGTNSVGNSNLYYPFLTTFSKEIDDQVTLAMNNINKSINRKQQFQKQQEGQLEQLENENILHLEHILKSQIYNNKSVRISQRDHHNNDSDTDYLDVTEVIQKDNEFDKFDQNLQDWGNQFTSLIPEILNNQEKGDHENNDSTTIIDNNGNEVMLIDASTSTTTTTTTTTTIATNKKLENEEISSIMEIKSFFTCENKIQPPDSMFIPLLKISNVNEVIRLLEAHTYDLDSFKLFLKSISKIDLSFLSMSQYLYQLVLPKVNITDQIDSGLTKTLTDCFIKHQSVFVTSLLVPLITGDNNLSEFSKADFIKKLISTKEIQMDTKIQFFSLFLSTILKMANPVPFNPQALLLLSALIGYNLTLNDQIIDDLIQVLTIQSKLVLSKKTDFENILFMFLSNYQKNLKEYVGKIQQIITNIESRSTALSKLLKKIGD